MNNEETTHQWANLSDSDKQLVVEVHCMGYKTKNKRAMRRVFDEGAPAIIFGTNGDKQYCQVAQADVTRMQLLINPILLYTTTGLYFAL